MKIVVAGADGNLGNSASLGSLNQAPSANQRGSIVNWLTMGPSKRADGRSRICDHVKSRSIASVLPSFPAVKEVEILKFFNPRILGYRSSS